MRGYEYSTRVPLKIGVTRNSFYLYTFRGEMNFMAGEKVEEIKENYVSDKSFL